MRWIIVFLFLYFIPLIVLFKNYNNIKRTFIYASMYTVLVTTIVITNVYISGLNKIKEIMYYQKYSIEDEYTEDTYTNESINETIEIENKETIEFNSEHEDNTSLSDKDDENEPLLHVSQQNQCRAGNSTDKRAEIGDHVSQANDHADEQRIRYPQNAQTDEAQHTDKQRVDDGADQIAAENFMGAAHGGHHTAYMLGRTKCAQQLFGLPQKLLAVFEHVHRHDQRDQQVKDTLDHTDDARGDVVQNGGGGVGQVGVFQPIDEHIQPLVQKLAHLHRPSGVAVEMRLYPVESVLGLCGQAFGNASHAVDDLRNDHQRQSGDQHDHQKQRQGDGKPACQLFGASRLQLASKPSGKMPLQKISKGVEQIRQHQADKNRGQRTGDGIPQVGDTVDAEQKKIKEDANQRHQQNRQCFAPPQST